MPKDKMSRRSFFSLGVGKTAKAAVNLAETRVEQRAKRYIRPPFAVSELDFLLKCTRCDACINACPQEIIFPLSAKLGIEVVSTPALDLLSGACLLCGDWPCVQACETQALKLPETQNSADAQDEVEKRLLPQLAKASIDTTHCLPYSGPECGACGSACPVEGAISWNLTKPVIIEETCIGCAQCRDACITAPKAVIIRSS